jgi:hypothetical protein
MERLKYSQFFHTKEDKTVGLDTSYNFQYPAQIDF